MAAYLAALLLVAASLLLGTSVCRACAAPLALAPSVGLALLIALATLALRLPGDDTTGAVVVALAVVASAVQLVRSGFRPARATAVVAALSGLGAAAVTTLPFLSAGHVGIPGMSLNNDTAVHVLWTDGLRSETVAQMYAPNPGYPLGPHSLLAAVAQGTGLATEDVLVGLLIATVILFAVTAAGVLRRVPSPLRVPAAVFAAVPYLAAAWFGQGAFKEPLMALLLVGFGLAVEAALARGSRIRPASFVPAAIVAAAGLLSYSYLAAAWLGVAGVLAVVLALVARRPKPAELLPAARAMVVPLLVGAVVAVVAAASELPRILRYLKAVGASPAEGDGGIGASELGNLAGPLPRSEVLGIWPIRDFRFRPAPDEFLFAELKTLAAVVLVGGALYLLARRRDVGLLAAAGAGVVVWALSDRGQAPYVTAKALVILSPLVTLVMLRALLPEQLPARLAGRGIWALRIAVAGVLVAAGLWSTQLVLRGSPVESPAQRDQLAQLRPLVERGPTLFIGVDDFVPIRLDALPLGYVGVGFPPSIPVPTRAAKPFTYGNALDWDSVSAETLDGFRYVVTVRSPFASSAPESFRLLRRTPLYEAWERTGPTAPRSTIEGDDAPARLLDCRRPRARALSRRTGVAAVERGRPVLLARGLPAVGVGAALPVPVRLPKGTWELAMKYTSTIPMRLKLDEEHDFAMPANTTRPGSWWPVGRWVSDGRPRQLWVIGERQSRLSDSGYPASVSGIVAVRPGTDELVPLRRACGRMVDWYRTS